MNKILDYNVTGQSIELASAAMLVSGTVNEYTARFAFNGDWDGYQRIAVFSADGVEREQLLTDDACDVPWEVLLPGAYLKVGVYGTRDGSRLPTIWTAHRQYIHDGACPTEEAADPSPVLAEQMLQRMGDLGQLKTEDKSSLVAAINEVKGTGGGGGTADHSKLKNRGAADQHPMSAITGLEKALEDKQPTGDYLTDKDLDATLTAEGKAADAKAVGDAISALSEEIAAIPSGKDGADGQDGITPTIGENGNWYLCDTDTGKPSRGEAGSDGHTPVRGVDYWTAEDQQSIVDDVLASLPTWEGGSY